MLDLWSRIYTTVQYRMKIQCININHHNNMNDKQ
jgi:hypothetical protein